MTGSSSLPYCNEPGELSSLDKEAKGDLSTRLGSIIRDAEVMAVSLIHNKAARQGASWCVPIRTIAGDLLEIVSYTSNDLEVMVAR